MLEISGVPASCVTSKYLPVSQRECQDLAEFVRKVLGPYSVNVTTAARLCSASLCQGKGRCVRQNAESSAYLHLPPPAEVVEKATEKVTEKVRTQFCADYNIKPADKHTLAISYE